MLLLHKYPEAEGKKSGTVSAPLLLYILLSVSIFVLKRGAVPGPERRSHPMHF